MAGEKRSKDCEDAQRDEKIIIIDIEGTTTSISFVKDTLFPYVRNNLKEYIEKNWENAEFKEDVKKLKEQSIKDEADKVADLVSIIDKTIEEEKESLMKNVFWQMDNDRKSGGLKQLQGHMWRDAYKSGVVKGHVYEDVPKSLEAWTKDNRKIYVYSSGSVEAQKLLFENTEHGNLLKYFTDYFDTEIGNKQESSSYKKILTKINTEGKNILFLTDVPKEAQAAIDAGMSSIIVIREGNNDLTIEEKSTFQTIKSFDDLTFKTSAKRVKIEETTTTEKEKEKEKEKKITETVDTTEDVEMKDVSETNVEKKDDDKSKSNDEKMQVEIKITKDDVKEEIKNDTVVKTDKVIENKNETEKNDKIKEAVVEASTSEVKNTETETSKKNGEKETTDIKTDDNIEVQKKTDKTEKTEKTEDKTDKKIEEIIKPVIESEELKTKIEVDEVKKVEVEKKNNDTVKSETIKEEIEKKNDNITEKIKIDEEKVVEEVKQNGKSKPLENNEKTEVSEIKVTNGKKTELNGDSKKTETIVAVVEKKEVEATIEPVKNETTTKIDVDAKVESVKEDEKNKDDSEKQQVNGNSGETKDKTHRNGVNEEKSKNGDNATDTETIKVKKVVEIIADGAGEADVTPPVAATS